MNLILTGYRGSGKTVVGTLLAKRLNWEFVDLDQLIAEQAGKSITSIFAAEGEDGFRERERIACQMLRRRRNCVIAIGGGAIMHPDNRSLLKRVGKIIWLRAPAIVLWSRIRNDPATKANRPDLTPDGGLAEVEAKLAEREKVYESVAHHIVDSKSASPDEIADAVELWFQANDASKA